MAPSQLRFTTFNCYCLKSSVPIINNLCTNNDIVFLQETWLTDDELVILKQIHPDFTGYGVFSMDISQDIQSGRPHGGLGILFRTNLAKNCKEIKYTDSRLLGCELTTESNGTVFFLNVYLPFQCAANHDDFVFFILLIFSILLKDLIHVTILF